MATQKVRQAPGAMDRQVAKQRTAARNRRIGVFAMVLALVAALVATYAITRGRTPEIPGNVTSIAPTAGPDTMVDLTTGEVTAPPNIAAVGAYYAVSPDGTKVAYNACCSPPAPLFVANVDGTHARILSRAGADAHGAQWSSDGSLIVYQQRDVSTLRLGDLFVVDADGGIGRSSRISTRHSNGGGGSCSRASRRMLSRCSTSCQEVTSTTRPGTSGPCRSPAGSRPSCGATPRGATTHRTGGRSRTSQRWTRVHWRHALDREPRRGNTDSCGPGADLVAEVVPGWDADLFPQRRFDLGAERRHRFDHEDRLGFERRVGQRSHLDHRTGRLLSDALEHRSPAQERAGLLRFDSSRSRVGPTTRPVAFLYRQLRHADGFHAIPHIANPYCVLDSA